jgi:hypothetical protein
MTKFEIFADAAALAALPTSAVPAAFDQGHLYSPGRAITVYALDPSYAVDYRPGTDFEPLPEEPRRMAERVVWWRNHAAHPVADFLGLRVGDTATVLFAHTPLAGTVLETHRWGARVSCPWLVGTPDETNLEKTVRRRNADGAWY